MKIKRITEMEVELNQLQAGDKLQIAEAEWKVLEVKDGKALIWKCTKIKDHVFNENNGNVYEGSDLQKYVQGDFKETIPMDILEKVTDEGFFLLTVDQIRKYMPNEIDRIATDEDDQTTWYWTASPHIGNGYNVRNIIPSGNVIYYGADSSFGVAPACWINLKS